MANAQGIRNGRPRERDSRHGTRTRVSAYPRATGTGHRPQRGCVRPRVRRGGPPPPESRRPVSAAYPRPPGPPPPAARRRCRPPGAPQRTRARPRRPVRRCGAAAPAVRRGARAGAGARCPVHAARTATGDGGHGRAPPIPTARATQPGSGPTSIRTGRGAARRTEPRAPGRRGTAGRGAGDRQRRRLLYRYCQTTGKRPASKVADGSGLDGYRYWLIRWAVGLPVLSDGRGLSTYEVRGARPRAWPLRTGPNRAQSDGRDANRDAAEGVECHGFRRCALGPTPYYVTM